jgi:hypothetical protein
MADNIITGPFLPQLSDDCTVCAVKDQVTADVAGEAVILQLKDGMYYGLNPVGASVWKLIQSPQTIRAIRQAILDEYEVDEATCQRDLLALLKDLHANRLIEVSKSAPCASS